MNAGLYIVQQVINAVSLGSLYALVAIGLSMVFGILRMTNFAHGDMMMVGAFGTLAPRRRRPAVRLRADGRHRRRRRGRGDRRAERLPAGARRARRDAAPHQPRGDLHPRKSRHPHLLELAAQFSDSRVDEHGAAIRGRPDHLHPDQRLDRGADRRVAVAARLVRHPHRCRAWHARGGRGSRRGATGRPRRQQADRRRLRHRLGLCRPRRRPVGGAIGHRRARHGLHAAPQGLRRRHHRRLRLDRRRARSAATCSARSRSSSSPSCPPSVSSYRDAIVFALLIAFLLFRPNGLLNRTQEIKL